MKFSKNNKIFLIIILLMLNIVIRAPVLPHELGSDSFYIHGLANAISDQGGAGWISHPLMLFGFSEYPLAVPFLISGLSQFYGVDGEQVILVLSSLTGILGAFAAYILIDYVTGDDLTAYFAALLFSISPEFLRLTIWSVSTRALFIALLPFFLLLLFKIADSKAKISYLLLFLFILGLLKATHNLFFLLPFCFLAFICALIIKKFDLAPVVRDKRISMLIPWLLSFFLLFIPAVFRIGFFKNYPSLWRSYQSGFLFQGEASHVIPLNLVVDYGSKIGILAPLAIAGALLIANKNGKNLFENFTLVLLLLLAPIMTVGKYVPPFLLIILAFMMSVGIARILSIRKIVLNRSVAIVVTILLLFSLCFAAFMMTHWGIWSKKEEYAQYMPETKNTAMFMKNYFIDGSFTSNERGGIIWMFSALSMMPCAPAVEYFPKLVTTKDYKLKINLDPKTVFSNPEAMISIESVNSESNEVSTWYEFPKLWSEGLDEGKEIINKYNIKYSVETNFGGYSIYFVKNMKIFRQIHEQQPKIFDNSKEEIWLL